MVSDNYFLLKLSVLSDEVFADLKIETVAGRSMIRWHVDRSGSKQINDGYRSD